MSRSRFGFVIPVFVTSLLFATPANAITPIPLAAGMMMFVQATTYVNQCVTYTYDKNGNLKVRSNNQYGTQTVWGASTFGCFSWTAP